MWRKPQEFLDITGKFHVSFWQTNCSLRSRPLFRFYKLIYILGIERQRPEGPQAPHPDEVDHELEKDHLDDMRFEEGRNGLVNERYRWPNGVVPYVFNSATCKISLHNEFTALRLKL